MANQSDEGFVLSSWVKKQLDAGDDPKVLKTVLKNRGMDISIVDDVLSSLNKNPPASAEVSLPEPKKTFINTTLKDDVDKILFSAKPGSSSKNDPMASEKPAVSSVKTFGGACENALMLEKSSGKGIHAEKENKKSEEIISETAEIKEPAEEKPRAEQNQVVEKESIFSLFAGRVRERLSGIKIDSPKMAEYIFDTLIVLLTGIAVAILLFALLISFGLNWYADWMARSVFV